MQTVVLIMVGGALGTGLRYGISHWLGRSSGVLPWHTLGANLLGCFLLGLVTHAASESRWLSRDLSLALTVGFTGGLTTFSTFAAESLNLGARRILLAAIYMGASVTLGLVMVWLGERIARSIVS